jgi:hypothetical protein
MQSMRCIAKNPLRCEKGKRLWKCDEVDALYSVQQMPARSDRTRKRVTILSSRTVGEGEYREPQSIGMKLTQRSLLTGAKQVVRWPMDAGAKLTEGVVFTDHLDLIKVIAPERNELRVDQEVLERRASE